MSDEARYVVSTCHDGSDWCVRNATAEEMADEADEKLPLEEARDWASQCANEHGCNWFDFTEGDS